MVTPFPRVLARCLVCVCVALSLITPALSFYSISYAATSKYHQVQGQVGQTFIEAPSAEHVADMYARLSGLPPLLREDTVNLPSTDIFGDHSVRPVIVEARGGRLPSSVTKVMKSSAFTDGARGPSLENVLKVLKSHGIEAKSEIFEGGEEMSQKLQQWISNQEGPVVILHHETPADYHYVQRGLQTSTVTPLTEFQISQYQICMWAAIIFISVAGAAVCAMVNMQVIPDSLLYAKFISARTQGKND